MKAIPSHLKRYIVEQDQDLYNYEDQAVWRFIMRQLFYYLKDHAHEAYVEGLKKSGISIDTIPLIEDMDRKLSEFGWRAVPVSGFIPPAAFMSFQANKILPIATEIRSFDHLLYTPAPDIVHEAAGHAPILIDPDFTDYLSAYAEVAQKAIISSEDMALYEAIRDLSDIKERHNSRPEEIKEAEEHLEKVTSSMTYVSEAQHLGRMNWWTAEYGLIGSLDNPKIYGAGLLSSLGEAYSCLGEARHLPLSINCLNYTYDITERQPQLFVAKDFQNLKEVLEEMANTMAFRKGGPESVQKALRAQTPCTFCLEDKTFISGTLLSFESKEDKIYQLRIKGPVLLNNDELFQEDKTFDFNGGLKVTSVYGGPSSFEKYPLYEDFKAVRIQANKVTNQNLDKLLKDIRKLRGKEGCCKETIENLKVRYYSESPQHWLAGMELLELDPKCVTLRAHLNNLLEQSASKDVKTCIRLGFEVLEANL